MKSIKSILHGCASARSLFFATIVVLALPNIALCFTERMGIMACITNVVLPTAAVWLLMTLNRCPGKMVWYLFLLVFFAAFQLVLLYLFGHSIIAVDMFLNLVTTNPGEAFELLDNLIPAVFGVIIVYVPLLTLAVVSIRRKDRLERGFMLRQRRYAAIAAAVGALSLGASYATDRDYRAELHLYPVNVFYNLGLAVERTADTNAYTETSAHFRFNAKATHPSTEREVYVLVIGETARACSFGLYGYGRETTPRLARTEGLVAFGKAVTQSNTTHKSVPMLLSAVSATDFNDIYTQKGIITAFKEAGFHTVFISNQRPNRSFIDFFGEEADEWTFIKERDPEAAAIGDEAMLPEVADVLAKGRQKEFIVLHMYGSHFNYRERYPRRAAFFKPDDATEAKPGNRPQLVNAYDNTIRFTDRFLTDLTAMLGKTGAQAALLYTSDHGENIFDDSRRLFLHASPVPSYYELHVPLMVWMSPRYRQAYAPVEAALRGNSAKRVATSASVFHTMLTLAGIDTPMRRDSLSVADTQFTVTPYLYLDDHNRAVPVTKLLRSEKDFEMFKKKGIALSSN
ncbi:MAG TPA: lipid A phosphoethanolamine transferase [Candidatus Prevotella stercoripullorum]|nr:lipid A phosphoethanolamine transferase [Candidatus Prevotella stercoripullorum]